MVAFCAMLAIYFGVLKLKTGGETIPLLFFFARHVPFMSRPYLQFRARFSLGIYPFVSGIRATRDPYSTPRVSQAKEEQTKKCREMFTKWGICYLGSFVVCEKIDW